MRVSFEMEPANWAKRAGAGQDNSSQPDKEGPKTGIAQSRKGPDRGTSPIKQETAKAAKKAGAGSNESKRAKATKEGRHKGAALNK